MAFYLCLYRRLDPGRLAGLLVSACVPVLARLETAAAPQQASQACLLVHPAACVEPWAGLAAELCARLFAEQAPERELSSPEPGYLFFAAAQADVSAVAHPYCPWVRR